jgi:hypothetical protein
MPKSLTDIFPNKNFSRNDGEFRPLLLLICCSNSCHFRAGSERRNLAFQITVPYKQVNLNVIQERAEVAKAAMQTDEAESQLNKLRKEYTTYKLEAEKKVGSSINIACNGVEVCQGLLLGGSDDPTT